MFGIATLDVGFGQLFACELSFARAGVGGKMGVAQRVVGGSKTPFVNGFRFIVRELFGHRLHGRAFACDLRQALGNFRQPPRAGGGAGRMADMDRRRLGPGAGQGTETKAAVGGNPGFAVDGIVVRAGYARQHALDHGGRHCAIGGHGCAHPAGERQRVRLSLQHLGVMRQWATVDGLQMTVGRDPGIEQAGGLEAGFEAGAL